MFLAYHSAKVLHPKFTSKSLNVYDKVIITMSLDNFRATNK